MTPPLVVELDPVPDPAEACERFVDAPYVVFLDSARDHDRLGRYSFLCADPCAVVRDDRLTGGVRLTGDVGLTGGIRLTGDVGPTGGALEALRTLLEPFTTEPVAGLPPFQGGAAGYIAYDWGATLERLPSPRYDDLAIPDLLLGIYDWVISWDHAAGRCWIVSTGIPERGERRTVRARERLELVRSRLAGGERWWEQCNRSASRASRALRALRSAATPRDDDSPTGDSPTDDSPTDDSPTGDSPTGDSRSSAMAPSYAVEGITQACETELRSSFTHAGYLAAVSKVRDYILAGDIFQANLTQRLEAPLREPAWTLYRRLRTINPAPFAAYLDMDGVRVLSASPERFLSVDADGAVEARPIKGTRPRGIYPAHDAALGRVLSESAKDRAENLMIVDLLRNDISRVCVPGSVHVPDLFALEYYSTVQHLVSTVTGTLERGRDAVDLLLAAFPGGSITGAPKVRAMEIIAELEPSRRGVYCGSVGYISITGAMDTSIVIRTYLALGARVYFGVGGGIVADSDPEEEYRESFDKARALISALAAGQ
ncbi:MAG TPA: aminodeoxychorismate synthase component I [Gemmatimonadaceae bacterium]|nr:aminodeoxychorismate synthase component I [Gemmatimonadaceae bacterium]